MKNTYRHIPFVRLLIPLVIGILWAANAQLPPLWYGSIALLPMLWWLSSRKGKQVQPWFGITVFAFLVFFGTALIQWKNPLHHQQHFSHSIDSKKSTFVGIVQGMPKIKTDKIEADVLLESIKTQGKWQPVQGRIKVYIKTNPRKFSLQYGDKIVAQGYINPTRKPNNPKAFDYARFLKFKGILHTCFLGEDDTTILEPASPNLLLSKSYSLKKQTLSALNKHLKTENERAVGEALILGFKDNMTDEVQNAYANTGATHVLAVSGLHVGILYMMIQFLFRLVKSKRAGVRWIKLVVSLLVIWGFALLTGASPSVLRAATMFSFVAVGNVLARNKNIYNTLAASAFFLLCIQPFLLFNIGFQLSYLAVVGIVFFQPLIYRSWYVKGKIGQYVWGLISVSLAAQITTLPISLFYFHQFPTYFILSGLVVIPAAFLIMNLGLIVMVLEYFSLTGFLTEILGQILHCIIWCANSVIFFIGKLPFNLIENIYLSAFETILCYLGIGGLMAWIETGKKWLLYAFFGMLILVGISMNIRFFQHQNQEQYVIYDTPQLLIDGFINGKCVTYQDPNLKAKSILFASKEYRTFQGVQPSQEAFMHHDFIAIGNKRFYILKEDFRNISSPQKIQVDGIILQEHRFIDFKDLEKAFDFDYIIADGSNKAGLVKKWRTFYKGEKPFYYTKEGAVILD